MSEKNSTDAEKWRSHQAKVLLESMCFDVDHIVVLEDVGIKLMLTEDQNVVECAKCGKKWEVDVLMLKDGRIRIKGFTPIGLGYRFSIECPDGCNKDSTWKENICWISILKDEE